MEALDARVGEGLENTTARATKYVHIRALACFADWLYGHTDDSHRVVLFTQSFLELEQINNGTITQWFDRVPLTSPIDLSVLMTKDCMRYLSSMEQRGVSGKSTPGNVRYALVYLCSMTELPRPSDVDIQLRRFFKELYHTVAKVAQGSNERPREGKKPFSFSMY
ncbi:hypothetical protein F441_14919 [Phytophthora nicotianae CJ01A1]|uniref:Uncharacterized protein n=3 Tax=Phytophthora nicotianae TaxID=4792 RepID=W2IF67_PHYNI|nr:hypothetical protein L915_14665 [Phytophthora nicotianae]ETL32909.1 hypothetical protein L916_14571 [Phytophthora nicotianae]ETM39335.1 hypothetical protein L914_14514 [Phytophthora nicotianae]ETO68044.1 hypothetical protein F444_15096 [Phytophthora nicotianae P1976]ETP09221.1 hypothetical protein F441_14919 [Phytophthora nicotianae CJ01A1]